MVVENESGVAEFSLLQADLSDGRLDRFAYYAFDCLYLDGYDLREAALIRRKELLEPADRNRRRRCSLQLPFRGGRQARAAARLRARSRRHHLEGQPIRLCLGPRQELGEGQVFGPAGVRHRRLRPLVHRAQGDRLAGAWRLRRRGACAMSDASAPAFPQASPRRCSRGSTRCAFVRVRSPSALTHGGGASSPLRSARAHRGGRFPRLDRRRPPASGVLSGLARRQAGPRDCARDDHGHERRARTSEEQRDADPSRSRLLAGRRRHQGRPRRLLCRGLAVHEAPDRRPGAGAGALPGRNRRTDVLPEARLEGAQPQYRPRQGSRGAGTAHQHSRLRRADGARAVGGARNPSLGIDCHRLGAAGHDRDGPRSRRRRGLDRGHRGGGRGSRAAEECWALRRS